MSKRMRLVIGVVTLALLVWIGHQQSESLSMPMSLDWRWLLLAMVIVLVDRILMAWKWRDLLRLTDRSLGLFRATQIYCASMVWGLFLPATVGADAVRIACTAREDVAVESATGSVVVERLIGTLASLFVGVLAFVVMGIRNPSDPLTLLGVVAFSAAFIAALAVIWIVFNQRAFDWFDRVVRPRLPARRLMNFVAKVHADILTYSADPTRLLRFFIASVVETLVIGVFFLVMFAACGQQIEFWLVMAAVLVATLISRIPFSIAGLGIFEGGMAAVLFQYGVSIELTVLVSLMGRLIQLAVWIPWWAVYLLQRPDVAPPQRPSTASR